MRMMSRLLLLSVDLSLSNIYFFGFSLITFKKLSLRWAQREVFDELANEIPKETRKVAAKRGSHLYTDSVEKSRNN